MGQVLSVEELIALCAQVGLTVTTTPTDPNGNTSAGTPSDPTTGSGQAGAVAVAVALALTESGGDVTATHKNKNGTTDYGLWQINSVHMEKGGDLYGKSTPEGLLTASGNAAAMMVVSKQGTDWSPWSSLGSDRYVEYMADVIDKVTGPAGTESLWTAPFDAAAEALDPLTKVGDVLATIAAAVTDVGWWKRFGLGLGGVAIIAAGAVLVSEDALLPAPLQTAVKALT